MIVASLALITALAVPLQSEALLPIDPQPQTCQQAPNEKSGGLGSVMGCRTSCNEGCWDAFDTCSGGGTSCIDARISCFYDCDDCCIWAGANWEGYCQG